MLGRIATWLRRYADRDGRGYPDWAMRYAPIVRHLRRRAYGADWILEVGANENGFSRFAHVPVVAVDVDIANLHACRAEQDTLPVAADACALPFREGTFEVCVCVDTFEHLPESARGKAASEISRVVRTSGTAVVAFPSGAHAARAEESIRDEYFRATGNRLRWFEEHDDMGLPSALSVEEDFKSSLGDTHHVWRSKNGNLFAWRWMWRVHLCGWPGRGNALFQAMLRLTTPLLSRWHLGRCYRSIIWIEPRMTKHEASGT